MYGENRASQAESSKSENKTNMAKGINTRAQIKRNEELKEKREKVAAERNEIKKVEEKKVIWKTITGAEKKLVALEEQYRKTVIESKRRKIRITMDIYEKRIKELNINAVKKNETGKEIITIDDAVGNKGVNKLGNKIS